jgi:hypothetical protein
MNSTLRKVAHGLAIGTGTAAAGYAGVVAWNRLRYGHVHIDADATHASLLDHFIPEPEILVSHHVDVAASAEIVLDAAKELEMLNAVLPRVLFKLREFAMGGEPDERQHPGPLFEQMRSIGWTLLAETAGREIVFGAVTKPWQAAPVFRSVPAGEFAAFAEPDFVKIAFALRADPDGNDKSIFRTETRAVATDPAARAKFRRYWSFVAPGVHLIRLALMQPIKCEAERRMYEAVP